MANEQHGISQTIPSSGTTSLRRLDSARNVENMLQHVQATVENLKEDLINVPQGVRECKECGDLLARTQFRDTLECWLCDKEVLVGAFCQRCDSSHVLRALRR